MTFHHHEVVGASMSKVRLSALRYPKDVVADVSRLVELHLRFHGYGKGEWTDAAVRRYVRDAGHLLSRLHKLTRADCTTRNKRKATTLARTYDDLEERIARLEQEEELAKIRPELDGNEIQQILGIEPGPAVGRAYKFLLDLRLDNGPMGKEAAAYGTAGAGHVNMGRQTNCSPSTGNTSGTRTPRCRPRPGPAGRGGGGRAADAGRRPRAGRRHVLVVGRDPRLPPPRPRRGDHRAARRDGARDVRRPHAPGCRRLARLLVDLTPEPLTKVFFADSGSVSVEVAIKMALQYWLLEGHQLQYAAC